MTKEQIQAAIDLEKNATTSASLPKSISVNDFCKYWPWIKRILSFAKLFTGESTDKIIDEIIKWGDSLCPKP